MSSRPKILLIQLRQLGDLLLTTPLVRQLKRLYPEAELHVLTEPPYGSVYEHNSAVDKILFLPKKLPVFQLFLFYLKIRRARYDIVIDALSNPKSAQITFFSGARERVGFSFRARRYAYTRLVSVPSVQEYAAVTKLRLIPHSGVDFSDCAIEMPISSHLRDEAQAFFEKYPHPKKIAFHVVSRRAYKIWDAEQFIRLGDWLIGQGCFLWLTYGPGEYEMAQAVYAGLRDKQHALLDYPLPSVPQLRAYLEHCQAYIGNDGGVKHLAVCAGIPTCSIFQNVHAINWTPPHPNHLALTNCQDVPIFCQNCPDKSLCFKDLQAAPVVNYLQQKNFLLCRGDVGLGLVDKL